MNTLKKIIIIIFIVTIASGCNELIDYSPYDADISSSNFNTTSIQKMDQTNPEDDTLRFAVFSDSHSYYDDLADAVKSINKQKEIQFVVCCGDITESGLAQEYNWYFDIVKKLKYPVITTIGNHDYLSNGSIIYKRMFGPCNFSFTHGVFKFLVFDNIVWENNNNSPDFDWLKSEITTDPSQKCILISHIPPCTDQLENYSTVYENILSGSNVMLNIHGHLHNYEEQVFASIPAIVSGSVSYRTYNIISLHENQYYIKRISF